MRFFTSCLLGPRCHESPLRTRRSDALSEMRRDKEHAILWNGTARNSSAVARD